MVSGPEKILSETENLSQGAEAQYGLSQSCFLGLDTVKLNLLAFIIYIPANEFSVDAQILSAKK